MNTKVNNSSIYFILNNYYNMSRGFSIFFMDLEKKFSISANLKKLRNLKGISTVAFHNEIGIPTNTLKNYENINLMPSLKNLLKISYYYGISIDFLLLWNKTKFPKSTYLLSLVKKIDSMDQVKRFQIESTANSLIGNINNVKMNIDNFDLKLTDNVHKNIKILRKYRHITQRKIAEYINVKPSQISYYETKSTPPGVKLIKISEILGSSIHSIATGIKLNCDIRNKSLQEAILKADNLLSLEDKQILIRLMERIIENAEND